MSIIPIESKVYVDGDRLMLQWTGYKVPEPIAGSGGSFHVRANCGGTVDVTAHIEQIVRRIIQPASGSAGSGR